MEENFKSFCFLCLRTVQADPEAEEGSYRCSKKQLDAYTRCLISHQEIPSKAIISRIVKSSEKENISCYDCFKAVDRILLLKTKIEKLDSELNKQVKSLTEEIRLFSNSVHSVNVKKDQFTKVKEENELGLPVFTEENISSIDPLTDSAHSCDGYVSIVSSVPIDPKLFSKEIRVNLERLNLGKIKDKINVSSLITKTQDPTEEIDSESGNCNYEFDGYSEAESENGDNSSDSAYKVDTKSGIEDEDQDFGGTNTDIPKEERKLYEKRENKKKYDCQICGKRFQRLHQILSHGSVVHGMSEKDYAEKHNLVIDFQCEKCHKYLVSQQHLNCHLKWHLRHDIDFYCEFCKVFVTPQPVRERTRGIQHTKYNFWAWFCGTCGMGFRCRAQHSYHLEIHAIEKWLGWAPKRPSDTDNQCHICGKTFNLPRQLSQHIRGHKRSETKSFKCTHQGCEKAFAKKITLNYHLESHLEKKNYKCGACGKMFLRKDSLFAHKQGVHSGKTFPCSECGKVFSRSALLSAHRRLHTGLFKECSICGKRFTTQVLLDAHQRVHTGEKPFSCEICSSRFGWKRNLGTHYRVVHKISNSIE